MLTKDRIGAVLAVMAAVIGLFLVFDGRDAGAADDDDDGPATGPSTSQIAPAPGGPVAPAPGGQVAPSAPGQVQSPAQTQAPADDDGDADGDDDDG